MKKNKRIKKNLGMDELAAMVQRGFNGVDERFNGVDERFNGVDERLDKLTYEMNKRFDQIEKIILEDHHQRIERLENQVKELQAGYRQLIGFKK